MNNKHYIQFFTATIFYWKKLLAQDKYKDIVLCSLEFLSKEKRATILGFVIMPNHIHIIWLIDEKWNRSDVQRDFLKFTSQQIKFDLLKHHPNVLKEFLVDAKDRKYQIWERNPLSVDLLSRKMIEQKLDYIHNNPLQDKWNLYSRPEDYYFSSAAFYENSVSSFPFLTHYMDFC